MSDCDNCPNDETCCRQIESDAILGKPKMSDLRENVIEILLEPADSVESMADEIISLCQPQWISEELIIALDTLSVDMHTKSKRPCSTCARISDAMNKHFGCSVINGYRLPEPPEESK